LLPGAVYATVAVFAPVAVAVPTVGAEGAAIPDVAGNTAVTVAEPALLETLLAPVMEKLLAATPVSVYAESGTTVIVAVYAVLAANVTGLPDQVIVVEN
jgi:hypothetical protein